ncbi:MAG: hypothetical protein U9R34_06450, partial [Nanoarchaeota archaeon]|nr:hypothetical protein [Nanoarchaeota archaeon]
GYSSSDLSGLSGVNVSAGNDDFVIAKFYKTNLSLVNINNLGGSGSDYFEYVIDSGDYYVAVGRSNSDISHLSGGDNTAGYNDFVIAKFYKTNLSLVKINNLGGGSGDYFEYVIDSGDYYVAVGFSGSDLSDFTGGNNTTGKSGKYDFVIAKVLKSNLSLVSINNLGGSDYDKFYSFVVSGDYYIAVGGSYSDLSNLTGGANTSGSSDFVIAKFGAGSSLPTYTNFSPYSETTNFSAVDLTNVTSLTLAINNKGKITFPLNHSINSDGENYDTNIKIEDAMIFVNSSALHSSFNDSATLTFYYVDCNKPYVFYSETASLFAAVLSENQRCLAPLCTNITCEGSILTVNVDHFTGFAAGTNANLTIEAEAGVKYALDSIEFYAWYINKTDGTPISGECNITFDDDWGTWFEMDYNGSEYNYTKSSGFASAGTHDYNVTCSNASFVTLEANDTKVVSPTDIPEFSTITLGLGLIAVLAGLVMIRKRK